jgi:hypothetical protein
LIFDFRSSRVEQAGNAAKPAQRIAFKVFRNRDSGSLPKSCEFETRLAHNMAIAWGQTPAKHPTSNDSTWPGTPRQFLITALMKHTAAGLFASKPKRL